MVKEKERQTNKKKKTENAKEKKMDNPEDICLKWLPKQLQCNSETTFYKTPKKSVQGQMEKVDKT